MKRKIATLIAATVALAATAFASGGEERHEHREHGGRVEVYGVVKEMPKTTYGTWTVGDRTVRVDRNTRIKQKYAPLKQGCTVEVKGVEREGVLEAYEVEVKR